MSRRQGAQLRRSQRGPVALELAQTGFGGAAHAGGIGAQARQEGTGHCAPHPLRQGRAAGADDRRQRLLGTAGLAERQRDPSRHELGVGRLLGEPGGLQLGDGVGAAAEVAPVRRPGGEARLDAGHGGARCPCRPALAPEQLHGLVRRGGRLGGLIRQQEEASLLEPGRCQRQLVPGLLERGDDPGGEVEALTRQAHGQERLELVELVLGQREAAGAQLLLGCLEPAQPVHEVAALERHPPEVVGDEPLGDLPDAGGEGQRLDEQALGLVVAAEQPFGDGQLVQDLELQLGGALGRERPGPTVARGGVEEPARFLVDSALEELELGVGDMGAEPRRGEVARRRAELAPLEPYAGPRDEHVDQSHGKPAGPRQAGRPVERRHGVVVLTQEAPGLTEGTQGDDRGFGVAFGLGGAQDGEGGGPAPRRRAHDRRFQLVGAHQERVGALWFHGRSFAPGPRSDASDRRPTLPPSRHSKERPCRSGPSPSRLIPSPFR